MTLPTTVWLTRHAETAAPGVFHGAESDIGLSELGFRQARTAAEWFAELKPTVVVSSGMQRAILTARPIAERCSIPHIVEPDLHERRVGELCGTSFSSQHGPWAETVARWQAGNTNFTTPGAESFDDMTDRLIPVFQRCITPYAGNRVLVVAHGVVCKVILLNLLEGWGPAGWVKMGRVANLAVSELLWTGEGWQSGELLKVPEPVAALSSDLEPGIGKSHA